MADATYSPLVYHQQGGDVLVLKSGGEVKVETGGIISANGTQAAHIANATGNSAATNQTTINSILVVLEGIGATATS